MIIIFLGFPPKVKKHKNNLELIKDNIHLSGQKCASDVLITHNIGRKF